MNLSITGKSAFAGIGVSSHASPASHSAPSVCHLYALARRGLLHDLADDRGISTIGGPR